jgi:ketosteroid isomerase-like protein
MRSSWIIAAVAAIGLIVQASAQDDMRQEAEKLIFAYAATFNKQDVAGLAAFYTKDGVIINQRGVLSGPSAIEEYLQTLFKAGFNHEEVTVDQVSPLGVDVAGTRHASADTRPTSNDTGKPICPAYALPAHSCI